MKNKIIIVGHPFSGYSGVEERLRKNGVAPAQPSFQEGITAVEIGSVLCRAHGITPVNQLRPDQTISQVPVGAVWNGMALDLMRGNLDCPLWCWSDPQAIHFLDYWKQLDPSLVFLLVYNHPRTVLSQDPGGAHGLTSDELEQRLHQWHVYNEALLHFFYRNRDHSLLLHAQPAGLPADQQMLQLLSGLLELESRNAHALLLPQNGSASVDTQTSQQQNLPVVHRYWIDHFSAGKENQLKQFLAGQLVSEDHPSLQLYEELQAVANLPEEDALCEPSNGALAAWRVFADLYKQSQLLGEQSLEKQQYIDVLEDEQSSLNNLIGEKDAQLREAKQNAWVREEEFQQENELLLQQLHQVQEELEKHFIEGQQKLKELESVQKSSSEQQQKVKDLQSQLESLNGQVKEKEQQLQQTKDQTEKNSQELKEENELLLLQLHQVQEELERYFLENRELQANQSPVYYGAADRLKGDMTYQLGATIMNASRKVLPIPFLPLILWRVAKRIRKQKEGQSLPALTEYRDFHEAEKVQKHLSYRLGVIWQKHIRTPWGWIYMPFALIGARIAYHRDRKTLGK